ncbi:alkaline phosphatase D family protein [Kineococcus arenarius]|uniref:alkaline phosphatase D family protein n=1 Tax=Kineococcus sp. SYSU DK007 TaxID=3383128 RepID=UPI003D7E5D37
MTDVPPPLARRTLLGGATVLGAGLGAGLLTAGALPRERGLADPFTLGVASGEPAPDGFVLWTRLAPDPYAEDGRGGMPDRDVPVRWEVAHDEGFRRIVRRGTEVAPAHLGHSVHVELDGLHPGHQYWYRFRVEGRETHISPAGTTRTAPDPRTWGTPLTMAFASCAQYEHGWFTAYRRMAEEQPDVVLFLGDYIYEYEKNQYVVGDGNVRDHAGPETTTLAGYRQRHAQYKADPDLQAAHAVAPWVVTWDDHEVENNYADLVAEEQEPYPTQEEFAARRAAAYQAYYENMPLRRSSMPQGPDMRLFRRLDWGRLASFHVLDTRQYRSDQPGGDQFPTTGPERDDPNRTILGTEQRDWLLDGLGSSQATWDVIAQQVMVHEHDYVPGVDRGFNPDSWDGYTADRQRLLDGFAERGVENPVVLTGDVHKHYAADLTRNPSDANADPIGVELVCTSITSGGDGTDGYGADQLADNPDLKLADDRRGYGIARLERDHLRADFRVLDHVSQPGAAVRTRASFVVEAGNPGLQEV